MASQYQYIHEKCEVEATFPATGKIAVTRVIWRDRIYEIVEVTVVTRAKKGNVSVWLINVATSNTALKLRFDADLLMWWVEELLWEE